MTRTIRNTYERKLSNLFTSFNKAVLTALPAFRTYEATRISLVDLTDALMVLSEIRLTKPSKPLLQAMVEEAMKAGVVRSASFLRKIGVQVSIGDVMVDHRVREVLFAREASLFKGLTEDMLAKIQTELSDGILKGEDMRRLAKRITNTVNLSAKRARVIARTETMYAFNTASREEFQRYGVQKVEWVAAMDERTCPKCGPLHGKRFKLGAAPDCPLHPNCRCVLIPFIEERV